MSELVGWQNRIVGHGEIDPRTLLEHPQNPKIHTEEQDRVVAASISEVGWLRGVLINRPTGHMLDGHERCKLAIVRGEPTVPYDLVDIPPEDEGKALLLLDPSGQLALTHIQRWAQLQTEVQTQEPALAAFFKSQAQQHGVVPGTLKRRVGARAGRLVQEAEVETRAEELRQQWGIAPGDRWQCGAHTLVCGDSMDAQVVQRLCQGALVDLVVTSPPYSVGKGYEQGASPETHRELVRGLADRCGELVKPGGFVVVNFVDLWAQSQAHAWTGRDVASIYPMAQEYWQIWHEQRGWDLYAQRIWYKPFAKLRQPLWTYHTSLAHQQEWEHVWTWRKPGGTQDQVYDWDVSSRAVWDMRAGEDQQADGVSTYWTAGYPICLPERAIRAHSCMEHVVWEPFLGSGTTLLACEGLGRICLGCDRDPASLAMTLERWSQLTGEVPERIV